MQPHRFFSGGKPWNATSILPLSTAVGLLLLSGPGSKAQSGDELTAAPPVSAEMTGTGRGQDFAVYERITGVPQADGSTAWRTNGRFTLIENGLHYWDRDAGAWQPSQDIIEPFPDGAIARYGPIRAIFSHDLSAESVFDLETPAGVRLRGGLRALEWLDEVTGERLPLAVVKPGAALELMPPHRLVARDAFEGVLADVVLEWRHNRISQNVVLRELPLPPAGFEPSATRLVVLTEYLEAPEPEIQRVAVPTEAGRAAAEDHVALRFDGASILLGHAFVADMDGNLTLGARGTDDSGAEPVRKTWTRSPGAGGVLEESVRWDALDRLGAALPRQARAGAKSDRDWRTARAERASSPRPVEVAQAPYRPTGLVVDFEIIPDEGTPTTLAAGQTYYIRTSYYSGSAVTFQPGCTIKFKHNAYMLLYGPVTFPDTLQTPVFTSKDDDGFGERIAGLPADPDSDGDPSDQKAAQALWIYYVNFNTTVQNARIRCAQRAIQYDVNPGVFITHTLRKTLLEHCGIGVYANLRNGTLVLDQVEKHSVPVLTTCPGYPYYPCGTISGTITQSLFYMTNSFRGIDQSFDLNWQTNLYANPDTAVADTMGAAGTSQFIEMLNGKITIFSKTNGAPHYTATLPAFLNVANPADPRILFDPHTQWWVACAMDKATWSVILRVSQLGQPDLASTSWIPHVPNLGLGQGNTLDFPTLGIDANGVYFAVQVFTNNAPAGYLIQALRKAYLTSTNYTPPVAITVTTNELDTWCIQPASNFDNSPAGGYTWFVAKGPPEAGGGGRIKYRRLQWTGTNSVAWADGSWLYLPNPPPPGYTNYYDIPQTTPALYAPYSGATVSGLNLAHVGSRLMMAVIRGTNLWTCHHVGLDGGDGDYDGRYDDPAAVDRSAIQWFKLQGGTSGLAYLAHGRTYDPTSVSTNAYWFHFPSLNVNAAGDAVLGYSGSKAAEYIGAFYQGRKANDWSRSYLLQAGRASWTSDRWGDYSATSVDPSDGSFWTVQEFGSLAYDVDGTNRVPYSVWGTWIGQIKVSP